MADCPTPNKVKHASEGGAWKQYQSLKRSRPLGKDWNVYRCRCGAWHLGHAPGSLSKRVKQALGKGPR